MTATSEGIAHASGVKVSAPVMLVMVAVIVTGTLAAIEVSPLLAVSTLMVTWLLGREARRTAISQSPAVAFPEFPASLRATIDRTMAELPKGDARRLLLNALGQARPLLAPHEGALDDRQENATRENVLSLADACCYTALELARLDAATEARDPAAGAEATSQSAAARELLVKRLSSAANALASLYVAGVMHGSPASELVAQLADEINADASARRAAANEISSLLGEGEQPPSADH